MTEVRKYIVTGSVGFIGSHLAEKLLNQGHQVLGIDSFDSYYSTELKLFRQAKLLNYSNYSFVQMNLSDAAKLDQMVETFKPDTILHMAAQAGVRLKDEEFVKYIDSNLVGFSNLILSVRKYAVPNFIYASSSSVYGNSAAPTFYESLPNLHPISFYGASKLAGEILATSVLAETSTRARGLRFFTVYGEFGRPDMAYFRILKSLLNKSVFEIYGDGSEPRDFTYISDVISSICALEVELETHKAGFCDVVNIGGGNPRSLNEMIEILEAATGRRLMRINGKKVKADVNKTVADSRYLQGLIGSIPETRLEEGLKNFASWGELNPEIVNL